MEIEHILKEEHGIEIYLVFCHISVSNSVSPKRFYKVFKTLLKFGDLVFPQNPVYNIYGFIGFVYLCFYFDS